MNTKAVVLLAATLACSFISSIPTAAAAVETIRTPNNGIQPQVVTTPDGTAHLIYYQGDARKGDIFYARQKPNEPSFSKPLQVNSQTGSAIAVGTIRGAQLAVGKNGRVHVAWNGSEAAIKAKVHGAEVTPLVYTRLNDAGTGFEPERNLLTYTDGLDGGGSVAADPSGNVYVTWHGRAPNAPEGEEGRAVYIARSADEGKTFSAEYPALDKPTGACGCCGMKSFAAADGAVYILYRAVSEKIDRDEVLLVSPKPGAPFEIVNSDPWRVTGCPMSSAFFSESHGKILGAWETSAQVFGAVLDGKAKRITTKLKPSGSAKRRHPVVIANAKGEMLLAWTEGTAWAKGGSVAWQVFAKDGTPVGEPGRADGVPVWSLVAAYAKPNGDFVVIY